MPRIPRTFTTNRIKEFIDNYIEELPHETIENIHGKSDVDNYRYGLYIGILTGITEFSGDVVQDIPKNN